MTDTLPEAPPPAAPAADAPTKTTTTEPTGPSVRSVLVGAVAVVAVVAGSAAFAAGGWVALGVVGLAGVAGTAGVARVVRPAPRRRSTPGVLRQLGVGRSAGRTPGAGTRTWPFTGNQSRRALSKGSTGAGKARSGSAAGRRVALPSLKGSGRTGSGKVAAGLTGRRAGRAVAAARGASARRVTVPTAKVSRPVGKRTATAAPGARRATAAKAGAAPRTPSRTPARPGSRPRLTAGAKGTRRSPAAAAVSRKVSRPAAKGRLATAPRPRAGVLSRISPRKGTGTRTGTVGRRGAVSRVLSRRPGGTSRAGGVSRRGGALSRAGRIGTSLGRRTTATAKPLGTRRRSSRGHVPNRTMSRPVPARPGSMGRLVRNALGVPRRKGLHLSRPTVTARRNARRALARTTATGTRRLIARAASWQWRSLRSYLSTLDQRARGLTAPGPLPLIPIPATPPRTEPAWRRYTQPAPQLVGRHAPEKGTSMSNPTAAVVDAYAQLARFEPENAREIESFLASLEDMHAESAASLKAMADRFSAEEPLQAPVLEAMTQLASFHAGMADHAAEVYQTFRTVHADDLAKLDDPAPNGHKWDITQNR